MSCVFNWHLYSVSYLIIFNKLLCLVRVVPAKEDEDPRVRYSNREVIVGKPQYYQFRSDYTGTDYNISSCVLLDRISESSILFMKHGFRDIPSLCPVYNG